MISLKELIDLNPDKDELALIKGWFILNNREADGIHMISELSESQLTKVQDVLRNAQAWIPILPDFRKVDSNLSDETAEKLTKICHRYLLGLKLNAELEEWASTHIPNMKTPSIIFRPAFEWLRDTYNIEFKDKGIK